MSKTISRSSHDPAVPPDWAKPIVADYQERKRLEAATAAHQAAEVARLAWEEEKLAPRRAAKSAPFMGHMANRPGENFRRSERVVLTRAVGVGAQRADPPVMGFVAGRSGHPSNLRIAGLGREAPLTTRQVSAGLGTGNTIPLGGTVSTHDPSPAPWSRF